MARGPWRLVTVDIDGTLTLVHGWKVLAERFGRTDQYERAMAGIRGGTATEDATIAALVSIAVGRTVPEVRQVLADTPKLAHIPEGVRRLHDEGVKVALLTHNPPYVTDWYRGFAGFDDAGGVRGTQATEPAIGPPIGFRVDKLGSLREIEVRQGVVPSAVVHVGDARPDAAVFPHVGAGVALNAERRTVDEAADLALHTHDFGEVVEAILRLPARVKR
jgi:phosphoserine phosphatase